MRPISGLTLRRKYDFHWDVLDVIISGKSSIDSPAGFQLRSDAEAARFLESYGYSPDNGIEKAELLGNFHEALSFVRKYFIAPENPDGYRLEVPRKILEVTDIRDLLLMAGLHYPGQMMDSQGIALKNWACSLLKVMHTIAHIDKDLRSLYFSDIQQQIFDRFYKVVHRDGEEGLYLGEGPDDHNRIKLLSFETKPKKSRESTILKLLHKPENVAEDIFDRVGIRFITHTKLDALRVVKFLRDKMLVMPPNIKPSRSRNTLVELDLLREQLGGLLTLAEKGDLPEETLIERLEESTLSPNVSPNNPHSSEFYRAIQFTCRQLIKLVNPLYEDIKNLKSMAKARGKVDDDWSKLVERIDMKYVQKEVRFFYPFEVQVVDRKSAEENEKGQSAHGEYKRAQVLTAMKRVMGSFGDVIR